MKTVKFDGNNLRELTETFSGIQTRTDAAGNVQFYDVRKNDWVALNDGDIIVNSEEGYYIGDESDVSEAEDEAKAFENAEANENQHDDGTAPDVVTSESVATE